MDLSSDNKSIASSFQNILKGESSFCRLKDETSDYSVDILTISNNIADGIKTCTTIGFSKFQKNTELIGIARNEFPNLEQLLASTVFSILHDKWPVEVGSVIPEITSFFTDGEMNHLLLMPPFLWNEELENLKAGDDIIFTYFVVPISDSEYNFAEDFGIEKLIELLNIYDIDISDLERLPVKIPEIF